MSSRRSKVIPERLVYPEKAPATAGLAAPLPPPPTNANTNANANSNATTASDGAPKLASDVAANARAGPQRPRLFHVASPSTAQPSVTPMSTTEPFSPGLNIYRGGGGAARTTSILPRTRVLVDHHVTSTGAVVRLERVDYSKAMRAYRVCRHEGGTMLNGGGDSNNSGGGSGGGGSSSSSNSNNNNGVGVGGSASPSTLAHSSGPTAGSPTTTTPAATFSSGALSSAANGRGAAETSAPSHLPAPWRVVLLRLFGAADMALLAIAVACFLVVVSHLRVSQQAKGQGGISGSSGASPLLDSAASSTSWLASLLASVTSQYGTKAGGTVAAAGAERESQPGALVNSASPSSSSSLSYLSSATAASYTQATHAASLDTSVTFAMLFVSVLLLAKRLASAVTRVYVEEVLVMRGVGLQFSSYGILNTLRYRIFVDLKMLRSLVIHDAFFRYQPLFYLSSSVENKAERVVYFPDTLPRLAVLRPVLNGIRGVLYGEPEEGPSLAELEERWTVSLGEISGGELFTEDSFAEDTVTTPDEGRSSSGTDH